MVLKAKACKYRIDQMEIIWQIDAPNLIFPNQLSN